jgi:hypothetical protein
MLTAARVASYWNVYYRHQYPLIADYPGQSSLMTCDERNARTAAPTASLRSPTTQFHNAVPQRGPFTTHSSGDDTQVVTPSC